MAHAVRLTVNGTTHAYDVEPRLLLVHFLRDVLGLTGTHVGCDTSQCGACTVLVDGAAVKSCTAFAVQADGADVRTIEGLATADQLHPIQQAFWEKHGLQCGFCTPGMVMTLVQVLERNPDPTEAEVRSGIAGNLCRCTGYENIVEAARHAAAAMLALGARTLWSNTNCRAIPSRKIGRAVRYCPNELRAWVAAGCPTDAGAADGVRSAMRKGAR